MVHVLKVTIKLSFKTTDRALPSISEVRNIIRYLSSSDDNGQSMVIPPSEMKHALSVVVIP